MNSENKVKENIFEKQYQEYLKESARDTRAIGYCNIQNLSEKKDFSSYKASVKTEHGLFSKIYTNLYHRFNKYIFQGHIIDKDGNPLFIHINGTEQTDKYKQKPNITFDGFVRTNAGEFIEVHQDRETKDPNYPNLLATANNQFKELTNGFDNHLIKE